MPKRLNLPTQRRLPSKQQRRLLPLNRVLASVRRSCEELEEGTEKARTDRRRVGPSRPKF